ncbi:MAG TPA: EamA family transporter [Syntrophomonadaceae bacterium]|nr:EamA family transporter [Syntrophomonadaceae bacterium]
MQILNNRGFIFLGITILFFSTYEVVSRTLVGQIDPVQVNFIRFFFGGLILLPVAVMDLRRKNCIIKGKDFVHLALLGLLMVGLSMNLLQYGINQTKANLAAVIFSSNPLFVALAALLLLKEHMTWMKGLGLLAGFTGVGITFLGGGGGGAAYYQGVVYLVLSALMFGIYTVIGKKITLKIGSVTMNSLTFIFGSLSLIPVLIFRHSPLFTVNINIWPQIFYLTVFVTGLAYYSYFKGLSMMDTSLGSMVFFIKPVLASLLAAIILGEKLTWELALGTFMVLASIYLVQSQTDSQDPEKAGSTLTEYSH